MYVIAITWVRDDGAGNRSGNSTGGKSGSDSAGI